MKKLVILFPALLILAVVMCSKPKFTETVGTIPASTTMFYTTLSDTIPQKNLQAFLPADVRGIKLRAIDGMGEVRYFDYHASPEKVLTELSKLGFFLADTKSDTTSRKVTFDHLVADPKLAESEYYYASSFWNADRSKFEAYECIKTPMKHQVLIDRQSNRILHRVVYLNT